MFSLVGKDLISCTFVFLFMLQSCNGEGYKPAPNCERLECPSYTVVHSQEEFEIRSYEEALWVFYTNPNFTYYDYKEAAIEGFRILSDYFQGNNSAHVRINMTAPLLTIRRGFNQTQHFYVPQKYQHGLPLPASDIVKTVKLPKHKYAAVRRFDGLANDYTMSEELPALRQIVRGTPYSAAALAVEFSVLDYTSPTQIENRVNEIILWFD